MLDDPLADLREALRLADEQTSELILEARRANQRADTARKRAEKLRRQIRAAEKTPRLAAYTMPRSVLA